MNKTALYLIYFCIYSAALLLIGKSSLREDPTARSYFLCDRTASLPLCICTFVGTWLSAITILSLTGGVYEDGLAVLAYSVFPWFLGAFLLAAVSRRLYAHNVVTIPELFGQRGQALLHLGIETDTQDMTGTVLKELPVTVTEEDVKKAAESFLGEQQQIPPMYSALKVDGKKLYELAREGKTVERKPRTVYFREISILEMKLPLVRISVTCSKGTYIRTLCHDIGQKLGCGGCMEELLRTRSGQFALADSLTLDQIQTLTDQGEIEKHLIGIEEILGEHPVLFGRKMADRLLKNGNPVTEALTEGSYRDGWVRMYTSEGEFIGIYQWHQASETYRPVKMFL